MSKKFLVVQGYQILTELNKHFLIDSHYKSIYAPVRIDNSSYRVENVEN